MKKEQLKRIRSACEVLILGESIDNKFMTVDDAVDIINDYWSDYKIQTGAVESKKSLLTELNITEDTGCLLYIAKLISDKKKKARTSKLATPIDDYGK